MKNILNNISMMDGFMTNEEVSMEIMMAEENGMSAPAALCYGDPDTGEEGDRR